MFIFKDIINDWESCDLKIKAPLHDEVNFFVIVETGLIEVNIFIVSTVIAY